MAPTVVKLLGQWFDKSIYGTIYGIWSICIGLGNVFGGLLVAIVFNYDLGIPATFWLPAVRTFVFFVKQL